MEQDNFQKNLLKHTEDFRKVLATPTGDWSVKGFIDIAKNIYTISVDTKVVSKIIELMMFPVIQKFAKENGSCIKMSELREGTGQFSTLGVKVFDDYWINYMTLEMARSAKLKRPPYSNLKEYLKYRNIKNI